MRLRSSFSHLALVLAPVAAAAVLIAVSSRHLAELSVGLGSKDDASDELPVMPPGFWHSVARPEGPAGSGGVSPAERARLVSLPYLGGRAEAPDRASVGVVVHDRERAWQGLNLYVSGHGPEAVLMDMEGRVLQRWAHPFERSFPGVAPTADTAFFRRVHLFPDGRVIALYQTGGLVFLDRSSRLLGRCPGNFYNDFWVGSDGRIWTLAKEARPAGEGTYRLDDFLVLLHHRGDGEGCREERRISITGALRDSAFAHLLEPMAPAGDVLHANTVVELDGALIARSPLFAEGNLLVSLREVDLVAIVDPNAGRVVWARRGPWKRQHEPSLLPSGRILLFDNRGHGGFSRLLEVDPLSGGLDWSWQGDPPASFASSIAGTCARLPGGTTLVTESVPGRAFELDLEGRIVWEFRTPHRAGPGGTLVAMLFEIQRLPAGYLGSDLR
jgi:hypothetical protein